MHEHANVHEDSLPQGKWWWPWSTKVGGVDQGIQQQRGVPTMKKITFNHMRETVTKTTQRKPPSSQSLFFRNWRFLPRVSAVVFLFRRRWTRPFPHGWSLIDLMQQCFFFILILFSPFLVLVAAGAAFTGAGSLRLGAGALFFWEHFQSQTFVHLIAILNTPDSFHSAQGATNSDFNCVVFSWYVVCRPRWQMRRHVHCNRHFVACRTLSLPIGSDGNFSLFLPAETIHICFEHFLARVRGSSMHCPPAFVRTALSPLFFLFAVYLLHHQTFQFGGIAVIYIRHCPL